MKINFKFHILVFIILVMIFRAPFVSFAQQNSVRGGAEIAAAEDAQAFILEVRTAAKRDANSDINQLLWCIGGGAVITLSCIGGALLGGRVGKVLDPPPQLSPFTDNEGRACGAGITTGMIYGFLGGWSIGFTGSLYGIYKSGTVPSKRLIGKSPEYIEIYTETYKKQIGLKRATTASTGCAMLHWLFLMWMIRSN